MLKSPWDTAEEQGKQQKTNRPVRENTDTSKQAYIQTAQERQSFTV